MLYEKVQILECCRFNWNVSSNLFRQMKLMTKTLTEATTKNNLLVSRDVHHKAINKT